MITTADVADAVHKLEIKNRGLCPDLPDEIRRRLWHHGFLADKWDLLQLGPRGFDGYLSDLQRLLSRTINGRYGIVLDDKLLLSQALAGRVAMPEVVFRLYGGRLEVSPRLTSLLHGEQPTPLFVKPVRGAMGKGLIRVILGNGGIRTASRSWTRDEFLRHLAAAGRDLIGTVGVVQHPVAASWFPGTVNTVRALTIRTPRTSEPSVVLCALRVGTRATEPLDNFSRGGLSFPVDIASGAIGPGVQRHPKGVSPATRHPDSGVEITGSVVPLWREIVAAALGAMSRLPYLHYVGWDIAIGTHAPIVIEGNSYSGVDVFQVHEPVLACQPLRQFYEHHGLLRIAGPEALTHRTSTFHAAGSA